MSLLLESGGLLRDCADGKERPIAKHHPVTRLVSPHKSIIERVLVPNPDPARMMNSDDDLEDWAIEFYEWLSLVGIASPRVQSGDSIDDHISRYRVPLSQIDSGTPRNIVHLRWSGLLPSGWVRTLFISVK